MRMRHLILFGLAPVWLLVAHVERAPDSSLSSWTTLARVEAAPAGGQDGQAVWGTIKRYTDSYVVVDGRTYTFAEDVVIDTYSLEKDERGNVRLQLDGRGRVQEMFFYGLDMPDVIRRYKL